ncbi:hypothetical protein B0H63DRAFT_81505 [Podospora didyma]|uniref:Uncharacterized protein n=1 Tax=Podospora didyma TaxID=330526 RepID=A0AAE0N2S1_9PEZI|nr:hypothetical protein B0H63DRAFT_81505 [Podospora didyma]
MASRGSSETVTPVELDAGGPPIRLSLATPISIFDPGSRDIFVRRLSSDRGPLIGVTERRYSNDGVVTVHSVEHFVDVRDPENYEILPLYARTPDINKTEWVVEVAYSRGALRVAYPFRSRSDALRFQQLLTGYEVVACFEDVTCTVRHKKPLTIRDPQYVGVGEIQLWRRPREVQQQQQNNGLAPLSPVSTGSSSSSSQQRTPTFATPPLLRRPASVVSNQSTASSVRSSMSTIHENGEKKKTVFVTKNDPPLLVAFLRDSNNPGGYTMLRVNITHLTQSEFSNVREEALLNLASQGGSTFRVYKHLPVHGRDAHSAWSLCEKRAPTSNNVPVKLVNLLDCTHMALNFGSRKKESFLVERERLDKQMLILRGDHLKMLNEETARRNREIVERPREMRSLTTPSMLFLPQTPEPRSPPTRSPPTRYPPTEYPPTQYPPLPTRTRSLQLIPPLRPQSAMGASFINMSFDGPERIELPEHSEYWGD